MVNNWFSKPSIILFYHRVASIENDPNLLSVNPENFEKQLLYLKDHFKIISLKELAKRISSKKIVKGLVAITFDDGYVDNLTNALPILEKLQVPATIFVTAGKIGSSEPFYWDEKMNKNDQGRALTRDELRRLAKNSLIEIGAHTITHPHLSSLPFKIQKHEIEESKKILEVILDKPVISFSYPFGRKEDFNSDTVRIIKEAGFEIACSTIEGRITNDSTLLSVPRRVVRNWDMSVFKKYLKTL
ncbi:MAG: polysaccharide deacetylase family protein [Candidatus Falkowbacteria bacterium]|nr:polysaccharide deacetylase family protein [Candidatus Falkowbacteria bacterium]